MVESILVIVLLIVSGAAVLLWQQKRTREQALAQRDADLVSVQADRDRERVEHLASLDRLRQDLALLEKYRAVPDAEAKAREIIAAAQKFSESSKALADEKRHRAEEEAAHLVDVARGEAEALLRKAREDEEAARQAMAAERSAANQEIKDKRGASDIQVAAAVAEAQRIVEAARQRAQEVAGAALEAKDKAELYEKAVQAMKNIVEGYDDRYIMPTYGLLDELAEEFGFTEAGQSLKAAREHTQRLVRIGQAATCEYVEANRKTTAIRFVVDAFNGKVDTILSRSKSDNYGTLKQQVSDAFNLVNLNGEAFRKAQITQEYLDARLAELKWAAVVQELKERDREEQRRIREQIREEERAQREFERAVREAAKEEAALQKAMAKVREELSHASEAQKAKFEAQMAELQEKLRQAEERNQRALSMAQQTKVGHVYVISNIGSFGDDVLKIGMTRRLEPRDRIVELGDASVPFPFDIHAMIYNKDAPALEHALHKHFLRMQMNKVNPRKEYFRVTLADVRREIESLGITATWTMTSEAREYRETLAVEKALVTDPEAQQEWTRQQMRFEAEPETVSVD